jgi:hypothetical protein
MAGFIFRADCLIVTPMHTLSPRPVPGSRGSKRGLYRDAPGFRTARFSPEDAGAIDEIKISEKWLIGTCIFRSGMTIPKSGGAPEPDQPRLFPLAARHPGIAPHGSFTGQICAAS